jgi:restriction system protein
MFEVLRAHPEGLHARDVISAVEARLPLTEFEKGEYPSTPGRRRFDKIARFCTIGPVKAGWLAKSKGTWTLTDEGWAAYEQITDPAEFMREASRRYYAWKRAQPSDDEDDEPEIEEEEVQLATTAAATLEEATEAAWSEIESYLRQMPPYEFQELAASLLRAMGYYVPWVAPRGKDGGVDIIAYTDPLGANGPRIKVQVKRVNTGRVGVSDLRSFMAVLGNQDVGLFVTLNGFSPDAEAEARSQENRRLTLLDLPGLFDLWVEHYDQLAEEARQRLPLRNVYFLDPVD